MKETVEIKMKINVDTVEEADLLVKKMLQVLEPNELDKIEDMKLSHILVEVNKDAKP